MTAYEAGFDAGERASYQDRKDGVRRTRPARVAAGYARGWWDGYLPRDSAWALRNSEPTKAGWWHERESEESV